MIDKRFVCTYPQKTYCGNINCRLSKHCSKFKTLSHSLSSDMHRKGNKVIKTEEEKKKHARQYVLYNLLFGDLGDKKRKYQKQYYRENRERILRKKRKEPSDNVSIVLECEYSCLDCPYEDCTMPEYNTRKEYMDLYYAKFHDRLLKQKAEYRENHREYLSNSEKLRNYQNKGYFIRNCIYKEVQGFACIITINKNRYISFISTDRLFSFRAKIKEMTGNMEDVSCNMLKVIDYENKTYLFNLEK